MKQGGLRFVCAWLITALIFYSKITWCQTLRVDSQDKEYTVTIEGVVLPKEQVMNELISGLPNKFLASLTLTDKKTIHYHFHIVYIIQFDLWEEKFNVEITTEHERFTKSISDMTVLESELSQFIFHKLPIEPELLTKELQLKAQITFNPISKKRVEKIQRWVSRGRARAKNISRELQVGASLSAQPQAPRAGAGNSLLNSILDSSIRRGDVSADWQSEVIFHKLEPQKKPDRTE